MANNLRVEAQGNQAIKDQVREYFHQNLPETVSFEKTSSYAEKRCVFSHESVLPYSNGMIVVYQGTTSRGFDFTVVPGKVIRLSYRIAGEISNPVPISLVEILKSKEQAEVAQVARNAGYRGLINFWI